MLKSEIWQKDSLGSCEKWTQLFCAIQQGFRQPPVVGGRWATPTDGSHVGGTEKPQNGAPMLRGREKIDTG